MSLPNLALGNSAYKERKCQCHRSRIKRNFLHKLSTLEFSFSYFSTSLTKASTDSLQSLLLSDSGLKEERKSTGCDLAFPFPLEEVGLELARS